MQREGERVRKECEMRQAVAGQEVLGTGSYPKGASGFRLCGLGAKMGSFGIFVHGFDAGGAARGGTAPSASMNSTGRGVESEIGQSQVVGRKGGYFGWTVVNEERPHEWGRGRHEVPAPRHNLPLDRGRSTRYTGRQSWRESGLGFGRAAVSPSPAAWPPWCWVVLCWSAWRWRLRPRNRPQRRSPWRRSVS